MSCGQQAIWVWGPKASELEMLKKDYSESNQLKPWFCIRSPRKKHRRRREWSLRKPTFEQVKTGGSASGWKEWGKKKIWKIFSGKLSFISSAFKKKNCKSRQTATAKRKDKNKELQNYSYYSLDYQGLLPSKFLLAKVAFYSFTKPIPCFLLGKVYSLTNWFGVWPYDNGCEQMWYKCLSRNQIHLYHLAPAFLNSFPLPWEEHASSTGSWNEKIQWAEPPM